MNNHIDTIAHALAGFVNGEAAPPLMSPECLEIMAALASLKQPDFQSVGYHAITILLERMQAGIVAERALKIMRSEDNPMRPN